MPKPCSHFGSRNQKQTRAVSCSACQLYVSEAVASSFPHSRTWHLSRFAPSCGESRSLEQIGSGDVNITDEEKDALRYIGLQARTREVRADPRQRRRRRQCQEPSGGLLAGTPLRGAFDGHEKTAQVLLDAGADIRTCIKQNLGGLSASAVKQCLPVTK